MQFVKFDIKQFSSGEWQVKIAERIYGDAIIHWNWFDKCQRDLMLLLTKIGAIKKQYGMIPITIYAPYLPYARQDRVFEAGQDLVIETLVKAIYGRYDDIRIETMALHCKNLFKISNIICYAYVTIKHPYNIIHVYPDSNARYHYITGDNENECIHFSKIRILSEIKLNIINTYQNKIDIQKTFLICDDICAGGRTFIECAKTLRKKYGDDIKIELMIYHAFLDYGLDALKESGISKIYIINPDSYEYICNLYPNDLNYFEKKEI